MADAVRVKFVITGTLDGQITTDATDEDLIEYCTNNFRDMFEEEFAPTNAPDLEAVEVSVTVERYDRSE